MSTVGASLYDELPPKLFAGIRAWLRDPEARLVLSVGAGGYRAFACTPVLKLVEQVLESRQRVAEVWGCSGGALAAHVFADGFDLDVLDAFAHRLYHRSESGVLDWSVGSVAQLHARRLLRPKKSNEVGTIQGSWLALLDRLQPVSARQHERRPFFAVASNRKDGLAYGLTDAEFVSPPCSDVLIATNRERALAASCAVPLLFPTQRGIGSNSDEWVDGGVLEENPLALPFIKWSRERKSDPAGVPRKLKVFLLDLNMRTSESTMIKGLQRLPIGLFKRLSGTLDMVLDSRSRLSLSVLSELPDVEVMVAKLSIGAFAVRDRASIPKAVERGRAMSAWSFNVIGALNNP
jgi:hypothetical protein